mgnify:CR=1 FL=1
MDVQVPDKPTAARLTGSSSLPANTAAAILLVNPKKFVIIAGTAIYRNYTSISHWDAYVVDSYSITGSSLLVVVLIYSVISSLTVVSF